MRFVTPDVVRLSMKDGTNWIEVKKELTVGEDKRFRSTGFKQVTQGTAPGIEVDWEKLALARVEAYLVDWSATRQTKDGKTVSVPVTPESIRALDTESFNEIDEAIQQHITEQADVKNVTSSAETPSSTLP